MFILSSTAKDAAGRGLSPGAVPGTTGRSRGFKVATGIV